MTGTKKNVQISEKNGIVLPAYKILGLLYRKLVKSTSTRQKNNQFGHWYGRNLTLGISELITLGNGFRNQGPDELYIIRG